MLEKAKTSKARSPPPGEEVKEDATMKKDREEMKKRHAEFDDVLDKFEATVTEKDSDEDLPMKKVMVEDIGSDPEPSK